MEDKKKSPQLRHFKDLSPDAQADRLGWLSILTADPPQPKRKDYLSLAEAAAQVGCRPSDLLDKGASGELGIYAPVLDDGLYVWPVTERGRRHSRVMSAAEPVFQARFEFGEQLALTTRDIKRVTLSRRVMPEGFVCRALTLQLIDNLEAERQHEQAEDQLAAERSDLRYPRCALPAKQKDGGCERMRELVGEVAWVPSSTRAVSSEGDWRATMQDLLVTDDMLRVDRDEIRSLREVLQQSVNATGMAGQLPHVAQVSASPNDAFCQYGEKRKAQIDAIKAGAKTLGIDPEKILVGRPHAHKTKIRNWCKDNHTDLFGAGDDPFDDAWDVASKDRWIVVANKNDFKK